MEEFGTYRLSGSEYAVQYATPGDHCEQCGGVGGVFPLRAVVVVNQGGKPLQRACLGCLVRARDEYVDTLLRGPKSKHRRGGADPAQNGTPNTKKLDQQVSELQAKLRDAEALNTQLAFNVAAWRDKCERARPTAVLSVPVFRGDGDGDCVSRQLRVSLPSDATATLQPYLARLTLLERPPPSSLSCDSAEGLRCARLIYEAMGGKEWNDTCALRWGDSDILTVPMCATRLPKSLTAEDRSACLEARINDASLVLGSIDAVRAHVAEQRRTMPVASAGVLMLDPDYEQQSCETPATV